FADTLGGVAVFSGPFYPLPNCLGHFRLPGRYRLYWQPNRLIVRHSALLTDLLEALQGLRDDLVRVEVAILRQPAAEEDAVASCRLLGGGAVSLVKLLAGGRRHGVERLASGGRRFVADDRLFMFLAGDMLDLDRAGVRPLVRVVDLHAGLAEALSERNEIKI